MSRFIAQSFALAMFTIVTLMTNQPTFAQDANEDKSTREESVEEIKEAFKKYLRETPGYEETSAEEDAREYCPGKTVTIGSFHLKVDPLHLALSPEPGKMPDIVDNLPQEIIDLNERAFFGVSGGSTYILELPTDGALLSLCGWREMLASISNVNAVDFVFSTAEPDNNISHFEPLLIFDDEDLNNKSIKTAIDALMVPASGGYEIYGGDQEHVYMPGVAKSGARRSILECWAKVLALGAQPEVIPFREGMVRVD